MRLFVIGSIDSQYDRLSDFNTFCDLLGKNLAKTDSTIILCSPYPDSCDEMVVSGIKQSSVCNSSLQLELHYPDTLENENEWNNVLTGLNKNIRITRFRHEAVPNVEPGNMTYAWLFSQLQAIANAHYVLVIGGKLTGSANLLIQLAEAQHKDVIPLPRFGGIGEVFFNRTRYKLIDFWGNENFSIIQDPYDVGLLVTMLNSHQPYTAASKTSQNQAPPSFFISYA